ncbi:hypothetical protein AB6G04_00145 [Proteus mirabilis]|uniref:hypothetical protein n=1 Tax=Proteus mirabilis TaxID=584 RepID=UPI0034DD3FCC
MSIILILKNDADKYIAMRRKTYSIYESSGDDERKVSLGKEGKAFDIWGTI